MTNRKPIDHGTNNGWRQHVARGDKGGDICLPCRQANSEYQRAQYAAEKAGRAPRYIFQREDWVADAACRGLNPSMFIIETGEASAARQAKTVCATCMVSEPCLDYALRKHLTPSGQMGYIDGIYAGTNNVDRRKIRIERERALVESISAHPSRGRGAA